MAGLRAITNVPGVENADVGDLVAGHSAYPDALLPILERIGLEL